MSFYGRMTMMIDLHTHSNASDGEFSPARLIHEAHKRRLNALALTDHDTLAGLESAGNEAAAAGIRFIPGIEINIDWKGEGTVPGLGPGGELHLLGLGLWSPTTAFKEAVTELSNRREARNRGILDRMHELSIDASWEELLAIGGQGGHSIGRLHFASLLIKKRVVRNVQQAFSRYLQPGKTLFVPKYGLSFDEAADLIGKSGGIPVLAHPMSLFIAWGRLPDLIKTLKERGLRGIEAWHPTAKAQSCRRLEDLGKSLGLYITEGSDFHGSVRPDRKLGSSNRGREINDTVMEAIPELRL